MFKVLFMSTLQNTHVTNFKTCVFNIGNAQTCNPSCDADEWRGFENVDDTSLNGEWIASCDSELDIDTKKYGKCGMLAV